MSTRIAFAKLNSSYLQGMRALDNAIAESGIDPWHQELIKIRASHINGCAYCVDKHTQEALKLGVEPRKIAVVPVWKEALSHFAPSECLILRLTEAITFIHHEGISDELYAQCVQTFGEEMTGNLIGAATLINSWNRVGIGLKLEPKF